MAGKLTASDLKFKVERGPDSHFFERSSMNFFGDTMANYGVRAQTQTIKSWSEPEGVECYVLYRKKPVKMSMQDNAYFNVKTFERVLEKKETT